MAPDRDEFVALDEGEIGLDRSTINKHNQIRIPQQHSENQEDGPEDPDSERSRSSLRHLRDSLNEKKHGAALKIRKTFHVSKSSDQLESDAPILANSITEKSDARLTSSLPVPDKRTVKDFIQDPVDTVKSKISGRGNHELAKNIAVKEVSHGRDVDLLNAQSAIKQAATETEKAHAIQNLDEMMKERQNMYVRWTLDRHISKVRILPRETFVLRQRTEFQSREASGDVRMDWKAYGHHLLLYFAHQYGGQYIGYGSDPPPPSKQSIMPNVERLIVASSPFQEFIMTTRRVYRWESRAETSKYLLIYLILWSFNLLLPGFLCVLVYLVLERKFSGNTISDLRADISRTEDVQKTALTLTEFVEKEGDEQWADKILESVGPWLMLQLCDMANFFEVLRNFYEWRVPGQTITTLSIITIAIITTSFTPTWLIIKFSTLSAGMTFFGLFPLATNFPNYRLLASPSKRIFWNIPTHAEWAVKSIQAEGTRYQQEHPHPPSAPSTIATTTLDTNADYGFYTAHNSSTSTKGRLIISATSIRFVSNIAHKVLWTLPYWQISRIEKIERLVGGSIPKPKSDSGKDLKIVDRGGEEMVLGNVDLRDQAFSQIVGFSRTVWQVVW